MVCCIVQYILVEVPAGSAGIGEGSMGRSYFELVEWKLANAGREGH